MSVSLKHSRQSPTRPIQVQRAGGLFKARWKGHSSCVFGATAEEAVKKLRGSPTFKRDRRKRFENSEIKFGQYV